MAAWIRTDFFLLRRTVFGGEAVGSCILTAGMETGSFAARGFGVGAEERLVLGMRVRCVSPLGEYNVVVTWVGLKGPVGRGALAWLFDGERPLCGRLSDRQSREAVVRDSCGCWGCRKCLCLIECLCSHCIAL